MKDVVWSVNILLGIGLLGVVYVLYYILTLDNNEKKDTSTSDLSEIDDK
jgi:hypothetical protein